MDLFNQDQFFCPQNHTVLWRRGTSFRVLGPRLYLQPTHSPSTHPAVSEEIFSKMSTSLVPDSAGRAMSGGVNMWDVCWIVKAVDFTNVIFAKDGVKFYDLGPDSYLLDSS